MTFNCPGQGVSDLPGAKFQPGPWVLILTGVGQGQGIFGQDLEPSPTC